MRRLFQLLLLAIAVWGATYSRVVLGPLQEAIRASLRLSDNQIALLQGLGLALPLALCSIPLGLLADRTPRVRILLASLALAMVSCVLSAWAAGFSGMLLARSLAGLSVAGMMVSAYSMVADLFAPAARGRAGMVMAIGELGGAPSAFALGGALLVIVPTSPGMTFGGLEGWRATLLWMSAILIPVLILMLTLHEPARRDIVKQSPLRMVWPELWRYRRVAAPLQLARATLFIADGAVFVWGAPLFARVYHLPADQIGAIMGTVLLIGGLLGPALGGLLVDLCQRRGGPRRVISVMAGVAMLSVPAAWFAVMPNGTAASSMLAIFLVLGFTIAAAAFTLSIIVIPGELRGLNLGISTVVGSIFFVGLAPLAVSGLSGVLGGEAKIGQALTIVCVAMSVLNAVILLIGRRHFPLEPLPARIADVSSLPSEASAR